MNEFIEKKLRTAKVFRIYLLGLLITTIGSFVSMGVIDDVGLVMVLIAFSTSTLGVSGIIYLALYMPFTGSMKWLKGKGMENVADDIILERPTLPRSKIYCGQRALFCKETNVIIPYAEIAWVYLYVRTSSIVVEKTVIVYTKDGRKFSLSYNADEYNWLLAKYFIPNASDIIIGFGAEQKALYKQLNPQSAEAGKRVKKIWGIVLMCIGAAFFITLLFNFKNARIVPLIILILSSLGSGAILYMHGKNK